MTGARDEDTATTTPTARRRRWIITAVVVAVIVLVAGGAILATYLMNANGQTSAEPTSSATAEPSGTPTPAPTPAPTPTPTPTGVAQPTDCYEIYGQEFLDTSGTQELNDPSVSESDISRYRAIEEVRETLPGIECHWGGATEGGIANAVNTVSPVDQARVVTLLGENEHVCAPENSGIICRQSETFEAEEGQDAWVIAEEHFFRDGLWVSTWWAGTATDISDTTIPMYETIWG